MSNMNENMNDEEEEKDLLRMEIEELSDMLRNDETWENLREILRARNIDPEKSLLVSFMEDDEDRELGVLVTGAKRVIEYKRSTTANDASFEAVDITDQPERLEEYPQVPIALAEYL
jgi:hypothetical protein